MYSQLPAAEAGAAGSGTAGTRSPLPALCAEAEGVAAGLAALCPAAGSADPGHAAKSRPGHARPDGLVNGHADSLGGDQEEPGEPGPAAARPAPGAGSGFVAGSIVAQHGAAHQTAMPEPAADGSDSARGRRAAINHSRSAAASGQARACPQAGAGQGPGLRWLGSATLEWVSDAPGDDGEDSPPAAQPNPNEGPPPPLRRALAAQAVHTPPEDGLAGAPASARHAASRSELELSERPSEPLSSGGSTLEPIQRGGVDKDADFEVRGGLGRGRSLGVDSASADQAALGAAAAGALARGRMLLGRAVRACEETSRRRGYMESLPASREAYTNRCALMSVSGWPPRNL